MHAKLILSVLCIGLIVVIHAQQSLESNFRTMGSEVLAAFEPQRKVLQTSSAVIKDGRVEISYGVVISTDGYILTKASEVKEAKALAVTVDATNYLDAEILKVDTEWDVALIKISATNLLPVTYASSSALTQGTWVVANGATTRTTRRLLAGIISAKAREIPVLGGVALGVNFKENTETLIIEYCVPEGGGLEAGLQKGDEILEIDGVKLKSIHDLSQTLKDCKPGTRVRLTYARKGVTKTTEVRLSLRSDLYNEPMDSNDVMSGEFSPQRSGFPRVIQHDILGSRSVVGGPLLDLKGQCVGMNIARANRAESFAIPVEELREIATRLIAEITPDAQRAVDR